MTTKYYLDLDGLKALIQKIVANDNTEAGLRKSITGQQDTYAVPTVTASTNYLTGATNMSEADAKLNDAIAGIQTSVSANNFRLKKLVSTDTGYSANWASQYRLERGAGESWTNISGSDTINIAKDQFLKNVEVVSTFPSGEGGTDQPGEGTTLPALRFEWDVITDSDGETPDKSKSITYVSIADFWKDTTVSTGSANTIDVQGGTLANGARAYTVSAITGSVGTAATGSTVLPTATTDANKLATVGDVVTGVNSAINNMGATVGSTTVATGKHVAVQVVEANGKLTGVTVTEDDIASAQGLANEITRAQNAEGELATVLGATGNEGSRAWTNTTNYNDTNNVDAQHNMQAIDTQVKANADAIAGLGSTYKALQTAVTDSATSTAQVVTKVTQDAQGVITATKEDLSDVVLAGYANPYTSAAPQNTGIAATDTVEQGLGKVEYRLGQLETSTGAARNVVDNDVITVDNNTANQQKLTVGVGDGLTKSSNKIVANLGTGLTFDSSNPKKITIDTGANTGLTLKKLVNGDTGYDSDYASQYELRLGGTKIGDRIDLVKDQFLKSVTVAPAAPQEAEGNSASITSWPALRFEWALDTDDQTADAQTVTYISVSDFAATGTFGTVDTTTGAIGNDGTAGFATVDATTNVINTVRTSLNATQTSSNGNNVNVTVTETNGLISAVSVADNTKNVVANDVYTVADGTTAGTQKLTISVDSTTITKANGALAANTGALNYTAGTSSADATLTANSGDTNKLATVGDVADKVEDFVNDRIADEIAELDLTNTYKSKQTAVSDSDGATAKVVSVLSQDANGEITVTKSTIGSMLMTGYSAKTGATNDDVKATDSVNAAIKKLEEKVDAVQAITASWVNNAFDAVVANPTSPNWPSGN